MIDFEAIERANLFSRRPGHIDANDIKFYHTMEIPAHGVMKGQWDLRANFDSYIGRTDYQGRSVLDIGTSNGFVAFEIEKRGAHVISVDLPVDGAYDLFPLTPQQVREWESRIHVHLRQVRNAFWLAHRALDSGVRLLETHVRQLDSRLSGFDVSIMGNVMQHLRDPIGMLLDIADRARTVIVTEGDWRDGANDDKPVMELFTSDIASGKLGSWFMLSPKLVEDLLILKGFSIVARDIHHRPFAPESTNNVYSVRHYTITAVKGQQDGHQR